MSHKKRAFQESLVDTGIGMSINIPLNWIMLTLGLYWGLGAFELSILMTTVFTAFAITRKYLVRIHFTKRASIPVSKRVFVIGDV